VTGLAQSLGKDPAEALASKQPAAAIGAGGDKLQLAGLKMASMNRHTRNIGGHGGSREPQSWARSAILVSHSAGADRAQLCDFADQAKRSMAKTDESFR